MNAAYMLPFCSPSEGNWRYEGTAIPHVIDEYAYATDTKIAFRMPKENLGKFPDVVKHLGTYWAKFPLDNPVPLSQVIPELAPRLYRKFDDDDGQIVFTEFVADEASAWVKLTGFQGEYCVDYLREIKRLPEAKVQEIELFPKAFVLLWECSGGGQGILLAKKTD